MEFNMSAKEEKTLNNILVKLTKVFSDFYILKSGHLISLDVEKPFIVELSNEQLRLLYIVTRDTVKEEDRKSDIIFIDNLKEFKKNEYQSHWSIVSSSNELKKVKEYFATKMKYLLSIDTWNEFVLYPEDEEKNEQTITNIFKENIYVEFTPKDIDDSPEVILTKSVLPLVSEKNFHDLYYASMQVYDGLYLLVFDFKFDLFPVYSFNFYIPFDNKE